MNQPHDTLPNDFPQGEELLAYLDGELDAETRRRLEEQLSTSGELRQRLKEYQQTWDLLDDLPRATVDDSFARTTVEMVAIQANDAVAQRSQQWQWQRRLTTLGGMVAVIAATWGGYYLTTRQLAEPNEQLLQDLPIIENLDAYKSAGDIEFLRALDAENLFRQEANDGL